MTAQVQPLFEAVVVFAWCFLGAVLPNQTAPEPPRERVIHEATKEIFDNLTDGVSLRDSNLYLAQMSPELREKNKAAVEGVLNSPKRHCLVMRYKLEPVEVGSYEATYKAKILTEAICPTSGYQSNIEYATITVGPAGEDPGADSRFLSDGPGAAPERFEITRWETEKVVPYDKNKDR